MQSQTMPRAVAAGAVIIAAVLVLLVRGPSIEPPPAEPDETAAPAPSDQPVSIAVAAAEPAPPEGELAEAKVRELEAMSETFRNTTFLIAIRDSGFVCNELLRVYGGIDDSGKWTATCSEMLAYTVAVVGNGSLHVEPMMQYFDAPGRAPIRNDQTVSPLPPPEPRER
jgi:hypothetical protein